MSYDDWLESSRIFVEEGNQNKKFPPCICGARKKEAGHIDPRCPYFEDEEA